MARLPPIAILVLIWYSKHSSFLEFGLIFIPCFAIYETPTFKYNRVFGSMIISADIFQRAAKF